MKQPYPLTIVNGRLVLPDGVRAGSLRCAGARIVHWRRLGLSG